MQSATNKELEEFYGNTGLSSNMEDYMEAIAMLASDNRVVRVKDIAKKLDIKMPSVTAALNKLKEMELIEYEKYGFVELTEKGQEIADHVYNKHTCLSEFFHKVLQLDPVKADEEACKVEHTLTPETCVQLHRFMQFARTAREKKAPWFTELIDILSRS